MKTTTTLFFILTFAFAGLQLAHAQDQQSPIDGRKFKIELMKDGKLESTETLIFVNSQLQTPDCAKYGFTEGRAYVKPTNDYFTFGATLNSDKEGAMAWQGSVKGDKIEGTCVWRKGGQGAINYTFKGTEIKGKQ